MKHNAHPSLLLVDDDPALLELISMSLGPFFQIRTAGTAYHALYELRTGFQPSLIITDYNLPDINGVRFLEMLRASAPGLLAPAVLLSSMMPLKPESWFAKNNCVFMNKMAGMRQIKSTLTTLLAA
jgi:CheY-like chemotaxis protein